MGCTQNVYVLAPPPFYKAELRECDEVMKVVKVYEKELSQCINFENSSLLFGKRVLGTISKKSQPLGIENEREWEPIQTFKMT